MKSVTKLKEKSVNIFKLPGRQTQDSAGHPEYRAESGLRERENRSFYSLNASNHDIYQ